MARAPRTGYDAHVPLSPGEALMVEFAAILFGCVLLLVGLFIGLLIGSVLVRAAVALANRFLGPVKPPDAFGQWDDWDADEPEPEPRADQNRAIPEPGILTGMLVTLLSGIINGCGYIVCAFLVRQVFDDAGEPDEWVPFVALLLLSLPVTGLVLTTVLMMLLPTTFWRAALAAFLHYLIVAVILCVVGGMVTLAWVALGA